MKNSISKDKRTGGGIVQKNINNDDYYMENR